MSRTLLIRITHGAEDTERALQGLIVASTAIASGMTVELWLMNEGVSLARPGVVESLTLAHSPPPTDLWTTVMQNAAIYACSPCLARRDIPAESLRDGVQPAGAAAFVATAAQDGVTELSF